MSDFKQLNSDLNALYQQLKQQKFSDKQIEQVFKPVLKYKKKSLVSDKVIGLIIFIVGGLYLLSYLESVQWHLSALSRIALIKLLPYWDWRYLKHEKCLISRSFDQPPEDVTFNCDSCESLEQIESFEWLDENYLTDRHIQLDVPVKMTGGLGHWPANSSFLKELLLEAEFANSYPCKQATNTAKQQKTAKGLILNVQKFAHFFLMMQNCESEAVKIFRRFTYRPDYLPRIYSPIRYNWLIWTNDYRSDLARKIELVEQVAVIGQILGQSQWSITPRGECLNQCRSFDFILKPGESFIISSLWDLYLWPGDGTSESLSAILETRD